MSYCPECGEYQAHVHLGWLNDNVRHARIDCNCCDRTSLTLVCNQKSKNIGDRNIIDMNVIIEKIRVYFGWKNK